MSIDSRIFIERPLGMNSRNAIIRDFNSRESLCLAKDKAAFKALLEANGIAAPRTYHLIHDYTDMKLITSFPDEFVVKPNSGFGGNGIILLQREDDCFVGPSGDKYSETEVKFHIRKILDGEFSGYIETDWALIEERIYPSPSLQFKQSVGLPDIRIICENLRPVLAMLRYPTLESKGRANLTQGALGLGLNLDNGRVTHVYSKRRMKELTTDELGMPPTFSMPQWNAMKEIARKCAALAKLGLCGVDIVLDTNDNILVLEVNGRPGLEIQNVNEASLLKSFKSLM